LGAGPGVTGRPETSDPPPRELRLVEGPVTFTDEGPRAGPALVAVHGIPGSVRDFRYLAPLLADRVRVVRVDLPGFGGSAPRRDAIDALDGRARVVLALADHLGIEAFAVLGHSMGGGTALVLAAEHRDRVDGLVLVASVALRHHRGLSRSPRAFRRLGRALELPLLRLLLLPSVRAAYRKRRLPGADRLDPKAFALQMRAIGAVDFERFGRAVARGLPKTLLAYAANDPMIEREISAELAQAIPHARVLAFEDGGHNIQKTKAAEIAEAIRQLLFGPS
jgi:pimeloyl-ACP methyl ester carboxylesterase